MLSRLLRVLPVFALSAFVLAAPTFGNPDGPQIELASPSEGQGFYQGQEAQAAYGCWEGSSGWPVVVCEGDVPLGGQLDTSRVGTHTFTVSAVDYVGVQSTLTHTYTVFDFIAPRATVVTPADGAAYSVGEELYVNFSCDDGEGGSPIVGCIGTLPYGHPLPTDRPGTFTFTVEAFDEALNHGTTTVSYRVVDRAPPTITILAPTDGAEYRVGEPITASYLCHDAIEGARVNCKATSIDSDVGTHTFRIDAQDSSGNAASASTTYHVRYAFAGFFSPLVVKPGSATVRAGDTVPVKFSLNGDYGLTAVARTAWRPCSAATNDSSPASGSLTYNAGPDRYTFMWATNREWSGSCKEFILTLRDGTTHSAYVSLR